MNNFIFKTKVDAWLLVVLYAIAAYVCYHIYYHSGMPMSNIIWQIAICGVTIAYVTYVLFYIKYEFQGDALVIHYHPFIARTIKLASIRKVERTNNPLASPAGSLDRLKITFTDGAILISPKNKAGFIARLRELSPNAIAITL